jgi:hypothetical protein
MAQIKGILVNDGGAPARIINFVAAEAISAGEGLKMDTAGKCALTTDNNLPLAGVALTDVASGAQCSMVTGSGLVLYMVCAAAVNRGDNLMTDEAAAGGLIIWASSDGTNTAVAYALEDAPAAGGLTKVLVV